MSASAHRFNFRLPAHGHAVLSKLNALREDRRFCDVTLLLRGQGGAAAVRPSRFRGHRVVLAASSDFLRDQFLLHEGRAELSVGVVSSVEVGERLLLSCYTGLLEVPLTELVNYLTAASALQMIQVVEKCAQAVSQYFNPTLASLNLETRSEGKEILQRGGGWPGPSCETQEERDEARPSASIQEADTEGGGTMAARPESRPGRGGKAESQGLGEVRAGIRRRRSLESGEGTDLQPVAQAAPTNEHGSQGPDGKLSARLQRCGEQTESWSDRHRPGDDLTAGADGVSAQRPYLCRRCDRVFQHLEGYAGHLKEHRRHPCLVCGEGFSQRSALSRHTRVHTGVKPLRCPLCHRTFARKAPLQDHFNSHTGDQPHKCKYCAARFAHKPGLRRHLKGIHGVGGLRNALKETGEGRQ